MLQGDIKQILLNEERKPHPQGGTYLENIIFEINYQTGTWKKLRRKRLLPGTGAAAIGAPSAAPAAAAVPGAATAGTATTPAAEPTAQPAPAPAASPFALPAAPAASTFSGFTSGGFFTSSGGAPGGKQDS